MNGHQAFFMTYIVSFSFREEPFSAARCIEGTRLPLKVI
jgi:hypothetical protein